MTVSANTIQRAIRSSHQRCSVRKGVLRNFANFRGKHLCQVLSGLWHRCIPVNFAKFLKTPFSQNTSGQLLLDKQHFLAENPSEVLNGQQQHKGVIFHWFRISPSLVKLF